MTTTSIEDVFVLLGEPIADKNEETNARFRHFVAQPKWTGPRAYE